MRRFLAAGLLFAFLGQSSGIAYAATPDARDALGTTWSQMIAAVATWGTQEMLRRPLPDFEALRRQKPATPPMHYRPKVTYVHRTGLAAPHASMGSSAPGDTSIPRRGEPIEPSGALASSRSRAFSVHRPGMRPADVTAATATTAPLTAPVDGNQLTASTTGINHWWTYEGRSIPGVGKAMANVGTGNLLVQVDDFDIHETGIDLAFQRTYNSQSLHDVSNDDGSQPGAYGNGWTNTFDAHITYYGGTSPVVSVYDIDGARYDYVSSNGTWVPSTANGQAGIYEKFGPDANACFFDWTKKDGTVYTFYYPKAKTGCTSGAGYYGRLYRIYGRNQQNYIELDYTWAGGDASSASNLSAIAVKHSDGQSLSLTFAKAGANTVLQYVTLPDGVTQYRYHYDTAGNLLEVDRPGNNASSTVPSSYAADMPSGDLPETYSLTEGAALKEVCSPVYTISAWTNGTATQGDCVYFEFDSNNRVTEWYDDGVVNFTPDSTGKPLDPTLPSGLQVWYKAKFVYATGSTEMYDSDGHSQYFYDDSVFRVTSHTVLANASGSYIGTSQTWDGNNNITSTTDANGNTTNYAYDANGNAIEVSLPTVSDTSSGSIRPTTTYSYDAYNNVIASCDAVYNQSTGWQPSTSDSLCPSVAGATYYSYTHPAAEPYGCMTQAVSPNGYATSLSYGSGCGNGLVTQVQGAPISQVDSTTRTPTQTFGYDPYGDITSYNKGEGAWALAYDTLHRVKTQTDPDGVSNYSCYYADGSTLATSSASQYHADGAACGASATSNQYDADGNQIQIVDHKGGTTGTTTKVYDGADRLVEVTQPQDTRTLPNYSETYDYYPFPWMTRYIYDLTETGSSASGIGIGSATNVPGYGNLVKTEECLPSNPIVTIAVGPAPSTCTWMDVRGTAFDPMDRTMATYEVANQTSSAPAEVTNTYDASGALGLLATTTNGAGQTTSYAYDALARKQSIAFGGTAPVAASRTYTFDPDGRTASVTSSLGTMKYHYDADGNETAVSEPSGQSGATAICYTYYGDDKRQYLSMGTACGGASGPINQQNLFGYSYRSDGALQTRGVKWDAASINGTFSWTYTAAGRELTESDPLSGTSASTISGSFGPKQYSYDAYGRVSNINFPEGYTEANPTYDTDDELTGYVADGQPGDAAQRTFTLNARGELLEDSTIQPVGATKTTGPYDLQPISQSANGTLVGVSGVRQFDSRSGQALVNSANPNGDPTPTGGELGAISFVYDTAGRQITANWSSTGGGSVDGSYSRTYDAENHLINAPYGSLCVNGTSSTCPWSSALLLWGPDGHVRQIATTAVSLNGLVQVTVDSQHWDGDTLLFDSSTNASLSALYIDKDAVIMGNGLGGYTWIVSDRDQSGAQIAMHTASNGVRVQATCWQFSNLRYLSFIQGPKTPTASRPEVCGGIGGTNASGPLSVAETPILTMPRSDGYSLGPFAIQGVRTYDDTSSQWTTPDAYKGDVHDPMSQKPYMWNGNNPVQYSDPSGYCPVCLLPIAAAEGASVGEIIGVIAAGLGAIGASIGLAVQQANHSSGGDGPIIATPPVPGATYEKTTYNNGQPTDIWSKNGDRADAEQEFDSLGPSNVQVRPNGTITGQLSNGTKVNVHSDSDPNSNAALEFQLPSGVKVKVRFRPPDSGGQSQQNGNQNSGNGSTSSGQQGPQ